MGRQGVGSENRRENRRHRRLLLEAEVAIRSEGGLVSGRTLDVSESGMAAVLPVELRVGETVGLEIRLPTGGATGRATVRSRNVGRHGFEFVQPLREAVVHQAAPDDCQNCGATGFILQALDGEQGVAFAHVKCHECGGTGRRRNAE